MLQTLVRPTANDARETITLLSVVVPVRNEAENIIPLVSEILATCPEPSLEIVYVDDGSTDCTRASLIEAQRLAAGRLICVHHRISHGQSAAVLTGVRAARGIWIATLDGDGQNDPADVPVLLERAQREAQLSQVPLLVAGHRVRRQDTWHKRVTSRLANAIRAALLRDDATDSGCGLKVFRRQEFMELPHFDHMHRFLPALFARAGGRVVSVPVNHRPRTRGSSNYGTLDRLWVGIFDIFGVLWLQRRGLRPEID